MCKSISVFILLTFMIWGCTKDNASNCQSCTTTSFRTDIIPILTLNCAISGCHTGPASSSAGNITLDSALAYAQVNSPGKGYIVAGSPNSSLLYSQLLAGFPNHMPNNGKQLDDCDIKKIYCWIEQGDLNN